MLYFFYKKNSINFLVQLQNIPAQQNVQYCMQFAIEQENYVQNTSQAILGYFAIKPMFELIGEKKINVLAVIQ